MIIVKQRRFHSKSVTNQLSPNQPTTVCLGLRRRGGGGGEGTIDTTRSRHLHDSQIRHHQFNDTVRYDTIRKRYDKMRYHHTPTNRSSHVIHKRKT
jgi:hypothetical protein